MTDRVLIIPAAGSGTRLRSNKPKFLTPVLGRPMISYLIDLYSDSVDLFAVVVNPSARSEGEKELALIEQRVRFFEQRDPTGMLDAILIPQAELRTLRPVEVWVTWCDQIAILKNTVDRLSKGDGTEEPAESIDLLFPTMRQRNPYIHFVRDPGGRIMEVLHARESDEMPAVGESDMGLFRLSDRAYFELLPEYSREAALGVGTGERNLLPFIPWLAQRGRVETFPGHDQIEALGINTPEDLERIERHRSSSE